MDDRRTWLFPDLPGHLDPSDQDDRQLLVEADHPDLIAAIEDGYDEIDADGEPMDPRLHLIMHQVVANQIWHDDPPEMWQAAQRLSAAGYDRHEVLHMLGSVIAGELWQVMREQQPLDPERMRAGLAALPESWERQRAGIDDGPPPGATLTHRLSAEEADGGYVLWTTDLLPLRALLEDDLGLALAGGGRAVVRFDEEGERRLSGPPGWLRPGAAGELIGFRVTTGRTVEVVPVEASPAVPERWCELVSEAFTVANEGDGMPVTVAELVNGALERLPGPPPVLPPAAELLEACGFEARDGHAAPQGSDWTAFGRVQVAARAGVAHGLDASETHAMAAVCELYRLFATGQLTADERTDADLYAEVAGVVGDRDGGAAFFDVVLGERGAPDPAVVGDVEEFIAVTERHAGRRFASGLAWARSVVARRAGDHDRAEVALRVALGADPDHEASLWDAAWYASDRGDARRPWRCWAGWPSVTRRRSSGWRRCGGSPTRRRRWPVATTRARVARGASTSTAAWGRRAGTRSPNGWDGSGRSSTD